MRANAAKWSLMLLCFSMAGAIGGGLYEHTVLVPLWATSPPSSFAMIQPGTGAPLQAFWIPVHVAITVFLLVSLVLAWQERKARRFLLIGLGSYVIMRVWSGLFFIPEMLAFQRVPLIPLHRWSSPQGSLGGRFGRGSEKRSMRFRSFPFSWRFCGWKDLRR